MADAICTQSLKVMEIRQKHLQTANYKKLFYTFFDDQSILITDYQLHTWKKAKPGFSGKAEIIETDLNTRWTLEFHSTLTPIN